MEQYPTQSLGVENKIHGGHFFVVFACALALVGITFMKNGFTFSFEKSILTKQSVPRYYAYQPEQINGPAVLGAQTYTGPSVINEDGTLSPALEPADVLGVTTEDLNLNLNNIKVSKIIPDSQAEVENYLRQSLKTESDYINAAEFESAIISKDQNLIDLQVGKINEIINQLEVLSVPESIVNLHKYKILQYYAGINLLNNLLNADNNPEFIAKSLGVFLEAQKQEENELTKIKQKFNLTNG